MQYKSVQAIAGRNGPLRLDAMAASAMQTRDETPMSNVEGAPTDVDGELRKRAGLS